MKTLIFFLCFVLFACKDQKQEKTELEWLYKQYLSILKDNDEPTLRMKINVLVNGNRSDDRALLKKMESLILERKKVLKLLDLQNPNFVLNEHLLQTYSQFLFTYPVDSVDQMKDDIKNCEYSWQTIKDSPSIKNVLCYLTNLAFLERRYIYNYTDKVGACGLHFLRYKIVFAEKEGKVGKNWTANIGGGGFRNMEDTINTIDYSFRKDGLEIKPTLEKLHFNKNRTIYLTFVPTQAGNYEFIIDKSVIFPFVVNPK